MSYIRSSVSDIRNSANDSRSRMPVTGHRLFIVIAILYLILSLSYDVVNPLFEGPDEHHHYFTVEYVAENWALPSVPQPVKERGFVPTDAAGYLGQEAAQPPLYYLITAPLIARFDLSQSKTWTIFNRFAALGDASVPANQNGFVHTDIERWPGGQGHVVAIYLLRHLSTLIGLATIFIIYKTGQLLFPLAPIVPLRAAALVAILPQFTFQHSLVSNDVLITLWTSLAIYLLVKTDLMTGVRFPISDFRNSDTGYHPSAIGFYLILGLTIGLAILTKNQGAVLLIFAVGFVLLRGIGRESLEQILIKEGLIIGPALLIGGWLWVRNVRLYGDWSAANQFVILAGGPRDATLLQVLSETPTIWRSFIAVFGWLTVAPPAPTYWIWAAVCLLGLLGLLISAPAFVIKHIRSPRVNSFSITTPEKLNAPKRDFSPLFSLFSLLSSLPILLFGWLLAVYLSLLLFMLQTEAAQGRLLFPAILPIALG
ncbi:MAG: phospholipid carrier-dependent glycosyltransferase, partial [Chloroflexota bacterium]